MIKNFLGFILLLSMGSLVASECYENCPNNILNILVPSNILAKTSTELLRSSNKKKADTTFVLETTDFLKYTLSVNQYTFDSFGRVINDITVRLKPVISFQNTPSELRLSVNSSSICFKFNDTCADCFNLKQEVIETSGIFIQDFDVLFNSKIQIKPGDNQFIPNYCPRPNTGISDDVQDLIKSMYDVILSTYTGSEVKRYES